MKAIFTGLALAATLAACAPRPAIPAAAQFSDATAGVGKALLPKVEPLARAEIARQRRAALAAGMPLAPLPENCNGFFTLREGVHFRDCPAEAPILGFQVQPTVETEALTMLNVYLAFGEAVGALARSTAPKDTAEAITRFATEAGALAKEVGASRAEVILSGAQEAKSPLPVIAEALLNAAKANSLCSQMKAGRKAFHGARQRLWVYTQKYVANADVSQPHVYFDAKDAGRSDVADAGYTAWKKAFPDSPFASMDDAAIAFDATLAACGGKP